MTPPLYLFSQEGGYFCYDATWTLAYTLRRTMEGASCNTYYN